VVVGRAKLPRDITGGIMRSLLPFAALLRSYESGKDKILLEAKSIFE